jgi:hypothetical protein
VADTPISRGILVSTVATRPRPHVQAPGMRAAQRGFRGGSPAMRAARQAHQVDATARPAPQAVDSRRCQGHHRDHHALTRKYVHPHRLVSMVPDSLAGGMTYVIMGCKRGVKMQRVSDPAGLRFLKEAG